MFTVLFVEDDVGQIEDAKKIFSQAGITMVECRRIDDLPLITDLQFDAIIWDGELLDGTSELAILRTRETFSNPMIAVSSSARLRLRQMQAGCTLSLDKPDALLAVVEMATPQVST